MQHDSTHAPVLPLPCHPLAWQHGTVSVVLSLLCLILWANHSQAQEPARAKSTGNLLEFRRIVVDGKTVPYRAGADLRVGPFPQNIVIYSGAATNSAGVPARLRFKLEG